MESSEQITQNVIDNYASHVNPTQVALLKIGGFDHVESHAEGAYVYDMDGNRYLDCLGGYGVFSLGHRHPKVVEAVKRQLDKMPLPSKTLLNKPLSDLCAALARIAPGDLSYAFICNSGTEAMEGALKAARMATGRTEFVAAVGSYHGKTMGALSASGREIYQQPFAPLVPGFVHTAWNDIAALDAAVTESTAGVVLEPIMGEGGIILPSDDYLPAAQRICRERGALLILDEVQTGLGRTGTLFACEQWGVEPDIMALAKALGGGVMPIGAFLSTPKVWESVFHLNPFIHTSTFGGGEMACAAALAAIEATIEEEIPRRALENGAYFLAGLKKAQERNSELLVEARGMGLMLGAEFRDADIGKLVIGGMARRGVIAAYTLNNPRVMRFEPPLIIERDQIDDALNAFEESLVEAGELLKELMEE